MKKVRWIAIVLLAMAAVFFAWREWGPGHTPPNQHALISLAPENMSAFQEAFNQAQEKTRIIVLLSPT